ncbi:MAG TPA: hypothetical protein DIC18_02155 [Clostridiales bacterium]|nr:hypothetical protein [Clostridiales bacterium]
MKKSTLKTYLITLFTLMLVFALTLTAFACSSSDNKSDNATEEEKEAFTSLVSNGDFSSTSGDTQPYSVSSWSQYTPSTYNSENTVSGIVSTGADYAKKSSAWGNAANPFGEAKDEKVLMIYNKELNANGYYATFETAAYGYYKLTVKVKVVNTNGGGATIRLYADNGFAQITDINNTDEFTTYTFYVEASSADSNSVTVLLALGYADQKVSGYAFFDDVVAEKITAADYNTAKAAPAEETVRVMSLLNPEGEFNYYTYNSSDKSGVHTPDSWTWTTSKTNSTTLKHGVVSTTAVDWDEETYGENPGLPVVDSEDDHVLMIESNQSSTAAFAPAAVYYASKSQVRFDLCTLYKIGFYAKVNVDSYDHISVADYANLGARIVLDAGSNGYATKTFSSKVINNGNEWRYYTIYVIGNQFSNRFFNIQIWLGDDKDNSTLVQGKAFFDKLTITPVKTFDASVSKSTVAADSILTGDIYYFDLINLLSEKDDPSEDPNLFENGDFSDLDAGLPVGYEFDTVGGSRAEIGRDVKIAVLNKEILDQEWTDDMKTQYGLSENPKYPYGFSNVLLVNNVIPAAYSVKTVEYLEIKQSLCYKLTVWMKTVGLDDGKNVTLEILNESGSSVQSFSVNTASDTNEYANGYSEYIFYFRGALPVLEENTNKVYLKVSNGSGSAYDPSSYQKGAFLIANISMEQIPYSEYSKNAGKNTKQQNYASNSTKVTNGNFNTFTPDSTEIDQETGLVALSDKDGNTHLTGAVSSWTNNVNSKYGTLQTEGTSVAFTLAKDATATQSVDLGGKNITKIVITGPSDYNKTFYTSSQWSSLLSVNNLTGKIGWKEGDTFNALEDGNYDFVVVSGQEDYNKLIAGIININNSQEYFDQFGLDRTEIYDTWNATVSEETQIKDVSFGAPNLLMITTRDGATVTLKNTTLGGTENDMTTTYALRSPSTSLEGSSYYLLKCYAKAMPGAEGEIYLTTTSTDAKVAMHKVSGTNNGWIEYNFAVETGLATVNAYFELYYGTKGDATTEFSGTLLFDSFTYKELTKEEYEAVIALEDTATSKFTTITFDNASAKEGTATPSAFSKTNSSTDKNTIVSGIISKDEFKYVTDDKDNLGLYETVTKKDEDGNDTDETEDVIIEGSALSASEIFTNAGMLDNATVGNYLLMINNRKATYQTYYLSDLSLESNSYYKFSVYVRTSHIEKDKYARVYVTISDEPTSFKVNTQYNEDGEAIENEWVKLSFYFKNEKDSSVSCKLSFELGESGTNLLQGYLFVDNLSLAKITEEEYTAGTANYKVAEKDDQGNDVLDEHGEVVLTEESKAFALTNSVIVLEADEEENTDEEETTTNSGSRTDASLIWAYITSIVIAAVLIAVIILWLFKKYYRPGKRTKVKKAGYDRSTLKGKDEEETSTGSARDEYKD